MSRKYLTLRSKPVELGVSHRTVEGWETGRIPNNQALATMKLILETLD